MDLEKMSYQGPIGKAEQAKKLIEALPEGTIGSENFVIETPEISGDLRIVTIKPIQECLLEHIHIPKESTNIQYHYYGVINEGILSFSYKEGCYNIILDSQ